ncbi:helix-turn-helix domain-containing protein, partial [Variovorax paradoxus]|uniref:IclR family transcriptional regulator n=3 Tax=Variovorax TaxID=34072 RepID=UPI001ABC7A49
MSTLANAMDVLKLIARLRRDITVTDVVNELGLPKSSASRTLSMMAGYGFLDRDAATRAYRPGGVIMEASYHFRASRNAASLVEEALAALVDQTRFTGYINVLDGADTLVIQMRAGAGALQIYTPPGSRAPAYSSAMGRALLARLS